MITLPWLRNVAFLPFLERRLEMHEHELSFGLLTPMTEPLPFLAA